MAEEVGLHILGNSGAGKTFLANILLRNREFKEGFSPSAVTTRTEFCRRQLGNYSVSVFNIPGLVESDQAAIERNKAEIDKAFKSCPYCMVLWVFGVGDGGRIRGEGQCGVAQLMIPKQLIIAFYSYGRL